MKNERNSDEDQRAVVLIESLTPWNILKKNCGCSMRYSDSCRRLSQRRERPSVYGRKAKKAFGCSGNPEAYLALVCSLGLYDVPNGQSINHIKYKAYLRLTFRVGQRPAMI